MGNVIAAQDDLIGLLLRRLDRQDVILDGCSQRRCSLPLISGSRFVLISVKTPRLSARAFSVLWISFKRPCRPRGL